MFSRTLVFFRGALVAAVVVVPLLCRQETSRVKHRVFYGFHYKPDHWRDAMARNIGTIEGKEPVTDRLPSQLGLKSLAGTQL